MWCETQGWAGGRFPVSASARIPAPWPTRTTLTAVDPGLRPGARIRPPSSTSFLRHKKKSVCRLHRQCRFGDLCSAQSSRPSENPCRANHTREESRMGLGCSCSCSHGHVLHIWPVCVSRATSTLKFCSSSNRPMRWERFSEAGAEDRGLGGASLRSWSHPVAARISTVARTTVLIEFPRKSNVVSGCALSRSNQNRLERSQPARLR